MNDTFDTIANFRSLDNIPIRGGGVVRPGMLYRSGHLADATNDDLARLEALDIRLLVDLRRPDERELYGEDRRPARSDLLRCAILPEKVMLELTDRRGDTHEVDIVNLIYCEDPETIVDLLGDGGAAQLMVEAYRLFVTDDGARQQFGRALTRLAEPGGLPAVFHCTAGKDRTGWLAALVLLLLGVDEEHIMANYLESNARRRTETAEHRARWIELGIDADLVEPFVTIRQEFLTGAIEAMRAGWGDVDTYVRDGLGIGDDVVAVLRESLSDDRPTASTRPDEHLSQPGATT
ncbi:MAG: tyrosine-protein phosphatase [Desertimonas sp.]